MTRWKPIRRKAGCTATPARQRDARQRPTVFVTLAQVLALDEDGLRHFLAHTGYVFSSPEAMRAIAARAREPGIDGEIVVFPKQD